LQIIDLDSLGMEIDMSEFFYYGVDAFKNALKVLKENPELKTQSLKRLIKIFPKMDEGKIEKLFDKKIELIEKATNVTIASKADFLNLQEFLNNDRLNPIKLQRFPNEIEDLFYEIKAFNKEILKEEFKSQQFANQAPNNHVIIEPGSKIIKSKNPSNEL
jgi:hypothetical protein